MPFLPEQRTALLIIAYLCTIVSGAALAYFGAAWVASALGYALPAPLPDDAFAPVLFALGLVFAASGWAITRLRQATTPPRDPSAPRAIAPDLRAKLLEAQMQRITNRLRDTLGEQARLELGLTTSPASVAPRWRRHFGTEQATPQPLTLAPPAPTPTLTPQQQAEAESLQRQMHESEESLRLIRERKAAFASPTDIPLQWDKDERAQEARLAEVREQFARQPPPPPLPPMKPRSPAPSTSTTGNCSYWVRPVRAKRRCSWSLPAT
ncbi:MAG: hypothetical protein HC911_17825 [Chloroflexaceae bacterium]|nr:hypothetical protein [Chloroflexaceae bacterium]